VITSPTLFVPVASDVFTTSIDGVPTTVTAAVSEAVNVVGSIIESLPAAVPVLMTGSSEV